MWNHVKTFKSEWKYCVSSSGFSYKVKLDSNYRMLTADTGYLTTFSITTIKCNDIKCKPSNSGMLRSWGFHLNAITNYPIYSFSKKTFIKLEKKF
jgi:hypothetical protein